MSLNKEIQTRYISPIDGSQIGTTTLSESGRGSIGNDCVKQFYYRSFTGMALALNNPGMLIRHLRKKKI